MKKFSMIILCFLLLQILTFPRTSVAATPPEIAGEAGILIDVKTGMVLFEKNPHKKLYPASITKVMTAILVLENSELDEIVTSGSNPQLVDGTRIYLEKGEELTVRQLLYAIMLRSANDAAVALAEYISGSVSDFVVLMNQKAKELGCTNTNFTNPHGLTDENHYTTAYDMAIIARYALKYREFRDIITTKSYKIPWANNEYDRLLTNGNKLLDRYEGADGVKTGYTSAAGQTIIASATRGGHQLLTVVLKTQGTAIWDDPVRLLDYGFSNFKLKNMIDKSKVVTTVDVKYGKPVALTAESDFSYVIPANTTDIREEVVIDPDITAPISKGEKLGKIVYSFAGKQIGVVNLVAQGESKRFFYTRWWFWALAIYIPFRTWVAIRRMRRRRNRYKYNPYISVQRWSR
jgi:D-alanyl-D-alanine carboxypeptidase (penicillin-binding protein 5/6)